MTCLVTMRLPRKGPCNCAVSEFSWLGGEYEGNGGGHRVLRGQYPFVLMRCC